MNATSGNRGTTPRWLAWTAFITVAVATYLVFIYVPNEATMGPIQRLFYFHVATAWNAFLAFGVVFVASILYLRTSSRRWDTIALASAEIGVLFTTMVLITGPIWAKPVWLTWWTWDPRLTTSLILWFIYLGYLFIRNSVEGERAARYAAVFGIIGFVDVPVVFMSIRWWRSIHPNVMKGGGLQLDPSMVLALVVSVVAFTILYFYFLSLRARNEALQDEVTALKEGFRTQAEPAPSARRPVMMKGVDQQ